MHAPDAAAGAVALRGWFRERLQRQAVKAAKVTGPIGSPFQPRIPLFHPHFPPAVFQTYPRSLSIV